MNLFDALGWQSLRFDDLACSTAFANAVVTRGLFFHSRTTSPDEASRKIQVKVGYGGAIQGGGRSRSKVMKSSQQAMCVFLVLLFARAAFAEEAPSEGITVERLAGTVYVLRSVGHDPGNIVASVGEDGIVMVDDRDMGSANKILAALATISNKPLRFVVNTHVHGDHTGGNPSWRRGLPLGRQRNN